VPDGEAVVTVPAGISPGRSLRLKGKGWPLRSGRGDLLLTVQLLLPEPLSPQEQALYEQLRQCRSDDPRADLFQRARI
jgi:curved DNA-binding protein